MNKLLNIIAVPLGFLALKSVSERIKDNPNPKPILSPTPTDTTPIVPLFPVLDQKPQDIAPIDWSKVFTDTGTGFQPTGDVVPLFAPFDVFKDRQIGTFEDFPRDITFQPFDVLGGLDFGGLQKAWATIGKK